MLLRWCEALQSIFGLLTQQVLFRQLAGRDAVAGQRLCQGQVVAVGLPPVMVDDQVVGRALKPRFQLCMGAVAVF